MLHQSGTEPGNPTQFSFCWRVHLEASAISLNIGKDFDYYSQDKNKNSIKKIITQFEGARSFYIW